MDKKVENQNALQKVGESQLAQQDFFVGQIKNLFAKQNVPLTDYQIKCGNNAVAKMVQMANNNGRDIFYYPQPQTLFALQNIIANEWDVLQGEGVIIFQNKKYKVEVTDKDGNPKKDKDGKVITQDKWEQYLDLRPTVKGHLKTIRMYGSGLNKVNPIALSYVVYEGDEFEDISYVGIEVTPPKYKPARKSNKVNYIVYALNMLDGSIQYVVGRREQVVPALIAQAKNNGAPDADLAKMMKLETVDAILDAYEGKTFIKENYGKKVEVPYFNDTWLAGYNREQMLETKLRGVIANRMIEKEFNNEFQKEAFEHVIIEKPTKKLASERAEQIEAGSQEVIENETNSKTFKKDPRASKPMVIVEEQQEEENEEETQDQVEETNDDEVVEEQQEEETVVEETQEEEEPQDQAPDNLFAGFVDTFKL